MKAVSPYLNFPGTTEDAFRFYQAVFGGELQIMRSNARRPHMFHYQPAVEFRHSSATPA